MNTHGHPVRLLLTRGLCALLLHAGCIATALAAQIELPPLVEPASVEHHTGKVIWVELVTPDLAGAERFYSGLFGWSFRDIHIGDTEYAVALLDGRPVGGVFQRRAVPKSEHRQPAWLTFIAVPDVDAAKHTALEHGAKVVVEPKTYPKRGRQAVLTDPDGATFAIIASSSGDPPDFLAVPGEWIWSSLLVRDPAAESAFYQALFGYSVVDVPSDDGLKHAILSSDDFARASVNALPGNPSQRHPHWLNFVRVVDAASMAAKAAALGGRVLVEPHVDRHGGNVAVIADPTGAPVGLMEWSETDSKEEPK
jgi:uncharacterized protein